MAVKSVRSRRKQIDDKDLDRVMSSIAKRVKDARKAQNLSQQVLTTNAGIAITTLSDIESERAYNLKLSTLVSLARQLKLKSIIDLID